jgi:hypothetical protein
MPIIPERATREASDMTRRRSELGRFRKRVNGCTAERRNQPCEIRYFRALQYQGCRGGASPRVPHLLRLSSVRRKGHHHNTLKGEREWVMADPSQKVERPARALPQGGPEREAHTAYWTSSKGRIKEE